jgi:FG-GAP repeat protein/VCBS repeat protein
MRLFRRWSGAAPLPRLATLAFLVGEGALPVASAPAAQVGTVKAEQLIAQGAGGFFGSLEAGNEFGASVAALGDLDGDGIHDIAVGATSDDDGGGDQGAVWIFFLNTDGTVRFQRKISGTTGGFEGDLDPGDQLGVSVAPLGDLDGDGRVDLAVGAWEDDDGGTDQGAVWILFLNTLGRVGSEQKISETAGGLGSVLDPGDRFGASLASPGDLDGDGITDLVVGCPGDDDGGIDLGALWILFLNADGTVKAEQKISATSGGLVGVQSGDLLGISAASVGDLDGDGVADLAAGTPGDDDAGDRHGAVWILFLNADGTVKAQQEINETTGGFGGTLAPGYLFGQALGSLGDLDGDGRDELAVGGRFDDDGGSGQGAVWILLLNADGTVKAEQKVSETAGGFGGTLAPFDSFGCSVSGLGDLDGDGIPELLAGAIGTGFLDQGGVWVLFLHGPEVCLTLGFETEDDLVTPLVNGQHIDSEFGSLVTLTSTGANQGLAVFDSTLGGPNDPSQDLDLLVGSGNLLILQTENLPPDANDVFPRPNDDEDGGTITLTFPRAVELRSLRLVDIDSGDGTSTVVLSDGSSRQRTYTVPGNWTGDRTLAQPGQGTLDLTTLLAQPGFGSSATAAEAAGFDPSDVVRLDVHLEGSGGLDDLELCSSSLSRASVSARNGTGVNPTLLGTRARPVLGATWSVDLDCRAFGDGLAILALRRLTASGGRTPFGEVLIGGELLHRAVRAVAGTESQLTWDIPLDLSLCGLEVHVQGLCQGSTASPSRPKTLHARARLSNALDLVLGF